MPLRCLKSLLSTKRSLVHSYRYSRLFHLSSIRGPLYLNDSNLNSRLLLQSMKINGSLFVFPVLPYSSVNRREPKHKFVPNCVKSKESSSVHPVVSRQTVHTAQLSESGNHVILETKRENELQQRLIILRKKLLEAGIRLVQYRPGQFTHLICPQCLGGFSQERSLSVRIDCQGYAVWKCFRSKCRLTGSARPYAEGSTKNRALNGNEKVGKQKQPRKFTEQGPELQPLCKEIVAYFQAREISAETLVRNRVMQRLDKDRLAIAFTYRRDGALISCKYRQLPKKFWQEAGTEKIFYGLDDIKNEHDIIIVEGEIDKLSMEEAGFKNCVSVPNGAPASVSKKYIPAEEEDTKYQYLWNCNEYLKSASRIILATDADGPGQALAEELARRLGKERCWRVKWPMKNDEEVFKDANEVLMYEGKEALREVVEKAEMYWKGGLFNFSDFFQEIDKFYDGNMIDLGISTGWEGLDKYYKASRIILATDADGRGQALAEELARRLGKERCWRVKWMKNDEVFKDANEVLFYIGKEALREVVENAERYPIRGLSKLNDFFQEDDKFYEANVIDLGISTAAENEVYLNVKISLKRSTNFTKERLRRFRRI